MSDSVKFSMGGRPPEEFFVQLENSIKINREDIRAALEMVKTGIRTRTARGVDSEGITFRAYSENGPFYYRPFTAGGKFPAGSKLQEQKSAQRLHSLLKKKSSNYDGQLSSTGRTIRFSSYGAFKRAFGRDVVDLQGVRAPHMLDAMVITVDQDDEGKLGIYGEESRRATGHNYGTKRLPRRHFFGFSEEDKENVRRILKMRISERLKGNLG